MSRSRTTAELMADMCSLVGTQPIAPRRGSTEPYEFYASLADSVGIERYVDGRRLSKRELCKAITGAAGLDWSPEWDGSLTDSGGGGSITNTGLEQLEEAVRRLWSGESEPVLWGVPPGPVEDIDGLGIVDEQMAWQLQRLRQQSNAFRRALVAAYEGRCAVTDTTWEPVLDASHIDPYSQSLDNSVSNGLLLRADVHRLFDRHMLLVEPDSLIVRFPAPESVPGDYSALDGKPIWTPTDDRLRPDKVRLARIWDLYWPK